MRTITAGTVAVLSLLPVSGPAQEFRPWVEVVAAAGVSDVGGADDRFIEALVNGWPDDFGQGREIWIGDKSVGAYSLGPAVSQEVRVIVHRVPWVGVELSVQRIGLGFDADVLTFGQPWYPPGEITIFRRERAVSMSDFLFSYGVVHDLTQVPLSPHVGFSVGFGTRGLSYRGRGGVHAPLTDAFDLVAELTGSSTEFRTNGAADRLRLLGGSIGIAWRGEVRRSPRSE